MLDKMEIKSKKSVLRLHKIMVRFTVEIINSISIKEYLVKAVSYLLISDNILL